MSRGPRTKAPAPSVASLLRWMPQLALLILIAIAGWLAAEWFWYFAGRDSTRLPTQPVRVDVRSAAESIASAELFGRGTAPPPPVVAQVSTLNLKLKGVFAQDSNNAVAIFNAGQRDEFAKIGAEVAPGVLLDSVHPTHIMIKRGGSLERVNIEERVPGAQGSASNVGGFNAPALASRPVPASVLPSMQLVPNQPLAVPAMPSQTMPQTTGSPTIPSMSNTPPSGIPNNSPPSVGPQSGAPFGRLATRPEGVAVEAAPPGSVLSQLGLQPGDVIRSVNGQPVKNEADLGRIYQQTANGAVVSAEVARGGQTVPMQMTVRR